jgi:hypothetical protein
VFLISERVKTFLRKQYIKKGKYYMKIKDVMEWLQLAEDDFDSAWKLIF